MPLPKKTCIMHWSNIQQMRSLILLLRLLLCFLFRTWKHSIRKTGMKTAYETASRWNDCPSRQLPVLPLSLSAGGLAADSFTRAQFIPSSWNAPQWMIVIMISRFAEHDMVHSNPAAWSEESAARWLTSKLNPFRKHPVHWSNPSSWLNPSWSASQLLHSWPWPCRLHLNMAKSGRPQGRSEIHKLSQLSMIGRHILWKSKHSKSMQKPPDNNNDRTCLV